MKTQIIVITALLCVAAGGPTSRSKFELFSKGFKIPPIVAEGVTRIAKSDQYGDQSAASPSTDSESSPRLRSGQREADLTQSLTPQNVFQLNGAEGDTPKTNFNEVPFVTISDWKLASWLNNEKGVNALFEETKAGDGIAVKADGVYSIFSNFVFGGVGRDCAYDLQLGKSQFRRCRWSGFNGADVKGINRHQPCALNFAAKLNKGDEVKMLFHNDPQKCIIDGKYFKRFLAPFTYLGIRKEF